MILLASGTGTSSLIMFGMIFAVMYFFMIRPQIKKQKKERKTQVLKRILWASISMFKSVRKNSSIEWTTQQKVSAPILNLLRPCLKKGNQMKISLESYHFLIDTFSIIYFSTHGVNQFVYYNYCIFSLSSLLCFVNCKF